MTGSIQKRGEPRKRDAATLLWLCGLCSAWFGIQFSGGVQFSLGAPLLQGTLRLSPSTIAAILSTAGPISGFIEPLIGAVSDRCTSSKLGRRRPFIIAGAVFASVGMLMVGLCDDLGKLLGDNAAGTTPKDHTAGITLAIAGLWVLNIFTNVAMGPSRAVLADIVPAELQSDADAMAAGMMGISTVLSNLLGVALFFLPAPYRTLFVVGAAVFVVSIVPTVSLAHERRQLHEVGRRGCTGLKFLDRRMAGVYVAYALCWASYAPSMFFFSDWFSNAFYGGSPRGVQLSLVGLAVFSLVQWLGSFAVSPLVDRTSPGVLIGIANGVSALAYVAMFFLDRLANRVYAIAIAWALLGTTGFTYAVFNSVPFTVVRGLTGGVDAGLYVGLLNIPAVVGQIVVMLSCTPLLRLTAVPEFVPAFVSSNSLSTSLSYGEVVMRENIGYAFLLGGAIGIVAAVASPFLFPAKGTLALTAASGGDDERKPLVGNNS